MSVRKNALYYSHNNKRSVDNYGDWFGNGFWVKEISSRFISKKEWTVALVENLFLFIIQSVSDKVMISGGCYSISSTLGHPWKLLLFAEDIALSLASINTIQDFSIVSPTQLIWVWNSMPRNVLP